MTLKPIWVKRAGRAAALLRSGDLADAIERRRIGRETAFQRLVEMSQNHNVKVREVAEGLVGAIESDLD